MTEEPVSWTTIKYTKAKTKNIEGESVYKETKHKLINCNVGSFWDRNQVHKFFS